VRRTSAAVPGQRRASAGLCGCDRYLKGAALDNARAQCSLGACYERGEGVARDVNEAVKW
jgi:hypothetical protein